MLKLNWVKLTVFKFCLFTTDSFPPCLQTQNISEFGQKCQRGRGEVGVVRSTLQIYKMTNSLLNSAVFHLDQRVPRLERVCGSLLLQA